MRAPKESRDCLFTSINVWLARLARSDPGVAPARRRAGNVFLFCPRRKSVSPGHRAGERTPPQYRARRCLGSRAAGLDALAREVVRQRLSGWKSGTNNVNATTALFGGVGKNPQSLGNFRGSADHRGTVAWSSVWFGAEYAWRNCS